MKKATVAMMVAVLCLVLIAATSAEEARLRRLVSLSAFLRTHSVATFDYEKFIEGSIGGMLKTLDPHSIFMNREDYRRMQEDQVGRFYGIGMIISMRNGKITVVAPIANTPAARIGLRSGDVIYEINGESTEDMNTNGAVTLLRGKKGTRVNITIKRPGVKKLLHFTVERAEIPERTVEYAFMADRDTGYILLKSFGEKSGKEMLDALQKLKKQGMKRLVLVLRNNPGGLLNAAVYISDLFLPKGDLVVSIKGRTSSDRVDFFAKKSTRSEDVLPLIETTRSPL
ncbi:MAG: peptidase S41, partial [Acidobacteria bacterium]